MVPILYILMRTDLDSMNPGKGMAQAAHAANRFIANYGSLEKVKKWSEETGQGFGTTIVLAVEDEAMLNRYVDWADTEGYPSGIIHDPSYPIRDGKVTHTLPLDTCGFIFLNEGPAEILKNLSLHP